VEIGVIREVSDLVGRHIVRLDNSVGRRKALLDRLATAGCAVDLTGNDWTTAGNFAVARVHPSGSARAEPEQEAARSATLRQEYILSHDGLSPGILSGTEPLPSDWEARRRTELGWH